jgi:uncharacterized Zn-binding protein involved in type VI secretion
MPAATRFGDVCTGHGCFGPRVNDEASEDVFINGIGAHRVGDHWVTHCCGPACHDSVMETGSSSVFINGRAAARIGDMVACGSASAQGSPSVFFGG